MYKAIILFIMFFVLSCSNSNTSIFVRHTIGDVRKIILWQHYPKKDIREGKIEGLLGIGVGIDEITTVSSLRKEWIGTDFPKLDSIFIGKLLELSSVILNSNITYAKDNTNKHSNVEIKIIDKLGNDYYFIRAWDVKFNNIYLEELESLLREIPKGLHNKQIEAPQKLTCPSSAPLKKTGA